MKLDFRNMKKTLFASLIHLSLGLALLAPGVLKASLNPTLEDWRPLLNTIRNSLKQSPVLEPSSESSLQKSFQACTSYKSELIRNLALLTEKVQKARKDDTDDRRLENIAAWTTLNTAHQFLEKWTLDNKQILSFEQFKTLQKAEKLVKDLGFKEIWLSGHDLATLVRKAMISNVDLLEEYTCAHAHWAPNNSLKNVLEIKCGSISACACKPENGHSAKKGLCTIDTLKKILEEFKDKAFSFTESSGGAAQGGTTSFSNSLARQIDEVEVELYLRVSPSIKAYGQAIRATGNGGQGCICVICR